MLQLLKERINAQKYIDLVFALQTLQRIPLLSAPVKDSIEVCLITYYLDHLTSQKDPRVLCSVLVYHISEHTVPLTMTAVCRIFNIQKSWFRKVHRKYFEDLDLNDEFSSYKSPIYEQIYGKREWRSFVHISNQ